MATPPTPATISMVAATAARTRSAPQALAAGFNVGYDSCCWQQELSKTLHSLLVLPSPAMSTEQEFAM